MCCSTRSAFELPEEVLQAIALSEYIAQKLHAVTNPRQPNDRFRDLIDLQLLDALHERARDEELRVACEAVFATRAEHTWPPALTIPPGWGSVHMSIGRAFRAVFHADKNATAFIRKAS